MSFKKISYSLPNLKSLLNSPNTCVHCIENCPRSLTIQPSNLDNLRQTVNEVLSAKVTTCDSQLDGIILAHKNIKVVNSVQLVDDGSIRLDYAADIYIFKPTVGCLLSGKVNKMSREHIGVLVHSVFNATIHRPRNDFECPKSWGGSDVMIGQEVTFEVIVVKFTDKLPFIKGKLVDVEEKDTEDVDSGIGGLESTEEKNGLRKKMKKKKSRLLEKSNEFPLEEQEFKSSLLDKHALQNLSDTGNVSDQEPRKKKNKIKSELDLPSTSKMFGNDESRFSETTDQLDPIGGLESIDEINGIRKKMKKKKSRQLEKSNEFPLVEREFNSSLLDEHALQNPSETGNVSDQEPRKKKKKKRKSELDLPSTSKMFGNDESRFSESIDQLSPILHVADIKKHKKRRSGVQSEEKGSSEFNQLEAPIGNNTPVKPESLKKSLEGRQENVGSLTEITQPGTSFGQAIANSSTVLEASDKKRKNKKSGVKKQNDTLGEWQDLETSLLEEAIGNSSTRSENIGEMAKKNKKKKSGVEREDIESLAKFKDFETSLEGGIKNNSTSSGNLEEVVMKKKKKKNKTIENSGDIEELETSLMEEFIQNLSETSGSLDKTTKKKKEKRKFSLECDTSNINTNFEKSVLPDPSSELLNTSNKKDKKGQSRKRKRESLLSDLENSLLSEAVGNLGNSGSSRKKQKL